MVHPQEVAAMIYRYQPRTIEPERQSFAIRHPHIGGFTLFVAMVLIGIMLAGCECGKLWPCPGGL